MDDEDERQSQPVSDPLGLLGLLSLPPTVDKSAFSSCKHSTIIEWFVSSLGSHVNPSRDGFDARKYLADLHAQTSFNDLQQGARTLRSLLRGQEMQLKVSSIHSLAWQRD